MPDKSEQRISIALETYKECLFSSRNVEAKAYYFPLFTFNSQVNGTTCREESIANG